MRYSSTLSPTAIGTILYLEHTVRERLLFARLLTAFERVHVPLVVLAVIGAISTWTVLPPQPVYAQTMATYCNN